MIRAEGLTKYYGHIPGILDVSFTIDKGDIVGFLGPNAAGKSTTLRILAGCMPPSSGRAFLAGYDVSLNPLEAKRRLGYLPEHIAIYPEMTVEGFLSYVADVKGVAHREKKREIGRVMDRCGVLAMRRRQVGHLSKGYRQRVGLAQALLGNPPVLILDEPTVGLDPQQIIEIREMIRSLAQDHTLLLSSHILPEVSMVCRRVIIIHRGRIVIQDALAELEKRTDQVRYLIEVVGSEDGAYNVLRQVCSVISVSVLSEPQSGSARFDVLCRDQADTLHEIAGAFVQSGFVLRSLERRRRTLEDVFVEVISSDQQPAEEGKTVHI